MITNRRALKQVAYEQALNPPRKAVTADQFEQILYDAIARDKTQPPAAIERWVKRHYEIREMSTAQAFGIPASSACADPSYKPPSTSRAHEVFHQQNGDVTKAFYADLMERGPIGLVAMNLFRAQKRSSRAKDYRRGKYRAQAYEVKQYSIDELCRVLAAHGHILGIRYGWKEDPDVVFGERASWVLYVDMPDHGQASFHSSARGLGPEYPGKWDGIRGAVEQRVIAFADAVMEMPVG